MILGAILLTGYLGGATAISFPNVKAIEVYAPAARTAATKSRSFW